MFFGLTAFIVYMGIFVGFDQIFVVIENVNITHYLPYYLLSLLSMLLVVIFWSASWKSLLSYLNIQISFKKALLYYWAGQFVDLIIPAQAMGGELTRIYLINKETKADHGSIAASTITNRIISHITITLTLTISVFFLITRPAIPQFALNFILIAWIGTLSYLIILLYITLSDKAVERLVLFVIKFLKILKIKRINTQKLSNNTFNSLTQLHDGFKFFKTHPKTLIKPLAFQIISIITSFLTYLLIFRGLGFNTLSFELLIIIYFIAGTIQTSIASFSVGTLEIALTNIFIFYGVQPALSTITATALRSVTFWFLLIVGYIITQSIGARHLLNSKKQKEIQKQQNKNTAQ